MIGQLKKYEPIESCSAVCVYNNMPVECTFMFTKTKIIRSTMSSSESFCYVQQFNLLP